MKYMDYAGVIIERDDGKMLFQLRDNKINLPHPNLWSIFGGGIEKREEPKQAALRELKEELNFIPNKEKLNLFTKIYSFKKKYHIFHIRLNKQLSDFKLKEGKDMKYLSRKELLSKKNVVPYVRYFFLIYPLFLLFKKKKLK